MKKLYSILICFILLFSFSACSDTEDKQTTESKELEVTFSMNEEKSVGSRVCLNTNLPVGTALDVEIFVGNKYSSKETVSVQGNTEGNYFITEQQLDDNGKEIDDGNYILNVELVSPASQIESVQDIIGKKGEYLKGTYVYTSDDGQTVKLSRPIIKEDNSFTMPD